MSRPDAGQALAVYSDYVCPFCYLGRASLERYLDAADDPPDVEWRFFDLRGYKRGPNGGIRDDVDDGKDESYFEHVRRTVAELRERYDVEMVDLDTARGVDSWNAQQAALYVRNEHGTATFRTFHDALFDALWRDGRDIGDPDVIAEVADGAGIPGEDARAATADGALEAALRERFEDAKRAGVTGIPTFVYGEHAARGAVPPDQLERLVGES